MIFIRQHNTNQGIGVLGLAFVAMLVMKLAGIAPLSWWVVFLPIYLIPLALLVIGVIWLAIWVILTAYQAYGAKKRAFRLNQMAD